MMWLSVSIPPKKDGEYLCKVKCKYCEHMVCRWDGEFWWAYNRVGAEGWIAAPEIIAWSDILNIG